MIMHKKGQSIWFEYISLSVVSVAFLQYAILFELNANLNRVYFGHLLQKMYIKYADDHTQKGKSIWLEYIKFN